MPEGRETIEVRGAKRYIRRDSRGRFTSSQDSVGRSLATDRRQRARTTVAKGQGDRGDQKR